jgi:hypothetical protein
MRIHADPGQHEPEQIDLVVKEPDLDLAGAKALATAAARERSPQAMLLAWNDRRRGESYPNFTCGSRHRPAWIVYAESRGANLKVNINDGAYTFLYLML